MEPWRTAITNSDDAHVWVRGYDLTQLMTQATFADMVFLLHQSRLPNAAERRLVDAILVAAADHGPVSPSGAAARIVASGNRASFEAAIAAGILAIGDAHGGAGLACMQQIARGIELAKRESLSIQQAAERVVADAAANGKRLAGMGHRLHSQDPRTVALFRLAQDGGLAHEGVAFMLAMESAAREKIKALPINVDGAIAAVLFDLGFPPAMAKGIFIIARVAGLTAQVMEEYTREKPMRIKIPVEYDGVPPK